MDLSELSSFHKDFSLDQVMTWIKGKLNREPESSDLYNLGRQFYELGSFQKAEKCLQLYMGMPGALLPGRHLLGYASYMCGKPKECVEALLPVLSCGAAEDYESDWQIIVEAQCEAESKQAMMEQEQAVLQQTRSHQLEALKTVRQAPHPPAISTDIGRFSAPQLHT